MPCETEETTTRRMPTASEIAAAIAVRYVDQAGKPEKKSAKTTWGELFHSVFMALGFIGMGALLVWWGWNLCQPLVLHYTTNLPTITFGRIFGGLLFLRSIRTTIWNGTVLPTYQLRLVK